MLLDQKGTARLWAVFVPVMLAVFCVSLGVLAFNGDTLFYDDFEGATAGDWFLDPGWEMYRESDGNHVLRGEGIWQWAILDQGYTWWTDYIVRFRLKLRHGGLQLNLRLDDPYGGDRTRYIIGFREDSVYIDKESPPDTYSGLADKRGEIELELGVWHDVQVVAEGANLRVHIDGMLQLEYRDPNPLPRGSVALETLEYLLGTGTGSSLAYVDDFRVTAAETAASLDDASGPDNTSAVINHTTSGRLEEDEIWRGDILITGDIFIPHGVTLTIESGTTVRFTEGKDDQHGGGTEDAAESERAKGWVDDPPAIGANMIVIILDGTLVARGTPEAPITLTSDSETPAVNDWQGIAVGRGGLLVLEHAVIEYNYWSVGLTHKSALAHISKTAFRHIATCAVCTPAESITGPIVISNNLFVNCGHEGVDSYRNQNILVENNLFVGNAQGVVANYGSTITIRNNAFHDNSRAINVLANANPTIVGNEITGSTNAAIWIAFGATATVAGNNMDRNATNVILENTGRNVDAEDNWWGTAVTSLIAQSIHDGNDDGRLGTVSFVPYAKEPFDLPSGILEEAWDPDLVKRLVDTDGDGVPDEEDYCPDYPGKPETNGC